MLKYSSGLSFMSAWSLLSALLAHADPPFCEEVMSISNGRRREARAALALEHAWRERTRVQKISIPGLIVLELRSSLQTNLGRLIYGP